MEDANPVNVDTEVFGADLGEPGFGALTDRGGAGSNLDATVRCCGNSRGFWRSRGTAFDKTGDPEPDGAAVDNVALAVFPVVVTDFSQHPA